VSRYRKSFGRFSVENVYGVVEPETGEEIVRFWLEERALPPPRAKRRVSQVVFVVRDEEGNVCGVNTVFKGDLPGSGRTYYFYRTFIGKRQRGSIRLLAFMAEETWRFLKGLDYGEPRPSGLAMVMENRKFYGERMKKWIERHGYTFYGKNDRGQDVWCRDFC